MKQYFYASAFVIALAVAYAVSQTTPQTDFSSSTTSFSRSTRNCRPQPNLRGS